MATVGTCTAVGITPWGEPWECWRVGKIRKGLCGGHYEQQRLRPDKALTPIVQRRVPGATEKVCSTCGVFRPRSAYDADPTKPDGMRANCKPCRTVGRLRKYSLTADEYEYVLLTQDYRCPMCNGPLDESTPHIDHDHGHCSGSTSCGLCVRGVTCNGCNSRLLSGYEALPVELRDSPRINEYLSRRPIANFREVDCITC